MQTDLIVVIFSYRLLPALVIDSQISQLQCHKHFVMVISSLGNISIWYDVFFLPFTGKLFGYLPQAEPEKCLQMRDKLKWITNWSINK